MRKNIGYKITGLLLIILSLSFNNAFSQAKDTIETLNDKGFYYYAIGDYPKSIEYFSKILALDPYNADAYLNRGQSYNQLADYDKVIKDSKNASISTKQ